MRHPEECEREAREKESKGAHKEPKEQVLAPPQTSNSPVAQPLGAVELIE